jgi:hypothetical protein
MAANRKNTSLLPNTDGTFNPAAVEERFADQPTGELTSMAGRGTTAAAGGNIAAMNEALAAGQEARSRMGAANQGMMPTPQGFGRTGGAQAVSAPAASPQPAAASPSAGIGAYERRSRQMDRAASASTPAGVVPGATRDIKIAQPTTGPTRQIMRNGMLMTEPVAPQRMPATVQTPSSAERDMGAQPAMASGTGISGYGPGGVPLTTSSEKERIENQPNLYERMMAEEEGSPKRQQLERQFNALPEAGRRAQEARAGANLGLGELPAFGQTGPTPSQVAQGAYNQQRALERGGPQAQPQQAPRAGQIIGDPQMGSMVVGVSGAQMPYVQDPMNPQGGALPISMGMTREQYTANITPQQRQGIRSMIMEQGGPVADQLQKIDEQRQALGTSPTVRNRDGSPRSYVGPQEQMLQQQEDDLLYGAMRDPSNIVSSRQRRAAEQERATSQEQRASQIEQERALKMEQQRNAKLFEQAYKEAESELTDPYSPRNEQQIQARAMQKYMQAGGSVPGARVGAGPGAGMMQPPSAAPQSGAPDFSAQEGVYVDPSSPVDFDMTSGGSIVAILPDGEAMAAMNFKGQAVALPRSAAEVAMLPPGAKYVLPGEVSRGQGKILTKEGEAGGLSAAARVAPEQEQEQIRRGAERIATERGKPIAEYESQLDEYQRLEVDARKRAVDMFNQRYGEGLLKADASGKPDFESLALRDRFQAGRSTLDAKGAYENEVQKALLSLAQERYADGKVPSWVSRFGTEITGVEKPRAPEGFRKGMKPGEVGEEDISAARRSYFEAQGARPENVMAERMTQEASRAWRSSTMRNGKLFVTYQGQQLPATRVRVGDVTATMPRPETAEQVMALLRSQRPFAVEQAGRAMPYKFDPGDPMVQAVFGERNKSIPANIGAGQQNAGANAAIQWANKTFGYLPMQVRKSIASALLAEAGYQLTG